MTLEPDEKEFVGAWKVVNGQVVEDEVSLRIRNLVREHLKLLATSPDGWDKLFCDPRDGRLWELTYPSSDAHGGGPPLLREILEQVARSKYTF